MPEIICMKGILKKGKPCWSLQLADGKSVYLIGDLSGVRADDEVFACGNEAAAAFCGKGPALHVTYIAKTPGGGEDALPTNVTRDVKVTITRSSADNSPTFRLEGVNASLRADGITWVGSYERITVANELDVFFSSIGWPNQEFTASFDVVDSNDSSKTWTKKFTANTDKGHAVIDKKMDVGAQASTAKEETV